jgi:hypothetical protein
MQEGGIECVCELGRGWQGFSNYLFRHKVSELCPNIPGVHFKKNLKGLPLLSPIPKKSLKAPLYFFVTEKPVPKFSKLPKTEMEEINQMF